MGPLMSDRPSLFLSHFSLPSTAFNTDQPDPDNAIRASDAKCGQLGERHNEELMMMLDWFIHMNRFPIDPKRVP